MMNNEQPQRLLEQAMAAAEEGNTLLALMQLERLPADCRPPLAWSYLGLCLARERRQYRRGQGLCQQALQQEPANSRHYLNLGRIYLLAGRKSLAIAAFRRGLKFGRDRAIMDELKALGLRRAPVFSAFDRSHLVNRLAGRLRQRFSGR
jgi:tetratricopeptide (TPR) repeat protein